MKKRHFLISGLVAAGITPLPPAQATPAGFSPTGDGGDGDKDEMVRKFAQDHRFTLAQHRSHSSHASHSSHRSGSSGRTRAPVYTPPPPRKPVTRPAPAPTPAPRNERSTPPSSILPSSPAIAPQSFYSEPSAQQIRDIVMRVQISLKAYGYYEGGIDGMAGPQTRAALKRFQTDYGLKVTGTITPEVLDAFKIST